MKFLRILPFLLFVIALGGTLQESQGETIHRSVEGGMEIEITYPDSVVVGRVFPVSILVVNNGWEEKQDVTFSFGVSEKIVPISTSEIKLEKISEGGSYGESVDFEARSDSAAGQDFLNIEYSHVLLANNEEPQDPFNTNIAISILVKEQERVNIHTITPESIFSNAEFPFTVEILSEDVDMKNVRIQIIPPKDIEFRGETMHTFSSIQKGVTVPITSRIITPPEEIQSEFKVPFQIIVSYTDDVGDEKTESKTVLLVMRPRTFMELTTDGGIWLGDFFIAPYVSLGTIIGIPAGAILSLLIRRSTRTKKKKKKKNSK